MVTQNLPPCRWHPNDSATAVNCNDLDHAWHTILALEICFIAERRTVICAANAASRWLRLAENPPKLPPNRATRAQKLKCGRISVAYRRKHGIKPRRCEDCGAFNSFFKTHGHHFDYARPLDVIWLCPECHAREHRRLRLALR